jgi:diguanylate cyclase (GGDEF)-like protein
LGARRARFSSRTDIQLPVVTPVLSRTSSVESKLPEAPERTQPWLRRPELLYSIALFLTAAASLASVMMRGAVPPIPHAALVMFFLLFGLVSIRMGYQHPGMGYVSFDRLAQVSSLLVVGPFHAAWINGFASLLFPLWRLTEGGTLRQVVTAALNNSGLMSLMIFWCGTLYVALGGAVALRGLDPQTMAVLLLLIVSMQVVNEVGLRIHIRLRDGEWPPPPSLFVLGMEGGSAVAGVLVAINFALLEGTVIALLVAVLCAGMLMLRQFARMRIRLEAIVEERTRVLHEKTLELEQLATHDQLTGLFNRRFADGYMRRRIEDYQRYHRNFSVALVDLDHFKRVNDELSHRVGDEVLRRVASILAERCRETDMVARWGGEEFLIYFAEADAQSAAQICDELRAEVASLDWSGVAPGVRMSLSAGVAAMQPGYTFGQLLQAADQKLYQAKGAGRNLVYA